MNRDDEQETTSYAVFGQGTWNFSEDLRLTAGIRYTEDEKDVDFNQTFTLGPLSPAPGAQVPLCQETFDETWDDTTWDVTLEKDLTADTFAYFKVNTGFKAGGINDGVCGNIYDQEEILAYEIGYKGTFRDGTLSLASSAFYYDYEDIQVNQVIRTEVGNSAGTIQNAADAEVYGLDLEMRAQLTDSFSMDFGLTWLPTAEYKDFETIDQLDIREYAQLPGGADPLDLSGNRLNRAPEYSGTFGLNYFTDMGSKWTVDARVELYFTDEIAFSPFDRPNKFNTTSNFPLIDQPLEKDTNIQEAYELLNAYVSFNYADSWTIRVYGKNLTDEYYYTGLTENTASGHIFGEWGRPREYGAQLVYRFTN